MSLAMMDGGVQKFVNACQSRNLLFFDQSIFIFIRVKIDSYSYDHKILLSSISHVTKKKARRPMAMKRDRRNDYNRIGVE